MLEGLEDFEKLMKSRTGDIIRVSDGTRLRVTSKRKDYIEANEVVDLWERKESNDE